MQDIPLQISYHYSSRNGEAFAPVLAELESQIGGERSPWSIRAGGIDFVTAFEVAIGISATYLVKPVISEYAKGLFSTDKAKELGESHRKKVISALGATWRSIQELSAALKSTVQRLDAIVDRKDAIALMLRVESYHCAFALNPSGDHHLMFETLPDGILDFLLLCASGTVPPDVRMLQFWYDSSSASWRFVFMPTFEQRFIDRVLDMQSGKVFRISSASEFIHHFSISKEDEWRFIFDPFAEQWNA